MSRLVNTLYINLVLLIAVVVTTLDVVAGLVCI